MALHFREHVNTAWPQAAHPFRRIMLAMTALVWAIPAQANVRIPECSALDALKIADIEEIARNGDKDGRIKQMFGVPLEQWMPDDFAHLKTEFLYCRARRKGSFQSAWEYRSDDRDFVQAVGRAVAALLRAQVTSTAGSTVDQRVAALRGEFIPLKTTPDDATTTEDLSKLEGIIIQLRSISAEIVNQRYPVADLGPLLQETIQERNRRQSVLASITRNAERIAREEASLRDAQRQVERNQVAKAEQDALAAERGARERAQAQAQERSPPAGFGCYQLMMMSLTGAAGPERAQAEQACAAEKGRELVDVDRLLAHYGNIGPAERLLRSAFSMYENDQFPTPFGTFGPVINFYDRLGGQKSWAEDQGAWVITQTFRSPGAAATNRYTYVFITDRDGKTTILSAIYANGRALSARDRFTVVTRLLF